MPSLELITGSHKEITNIAKHNLYAVAKRHGSSLGPEARNVLDKFVEQSMRGYSSSMSMICRGANGCPFASACQPAGSLVLTSNRGYVPIEQLVEGSDRVISYDNKGRSKRAFVTSGRDFKLYSKDYTGNLITISTSKNSHKVTTDHICMAFWKERAKDKFVVYLMRKGDCFRIGQTQLIKKYGSSVGTTFGISTRCSAERADAAWILEVHENLSDALLAEDRLSSQLGVTKVLFNASHARKTTKWNGLYKWATQEKIDDHHKACKKPLSYYSALLESKGLDIRYPIWEKSEKVTQKGSTKRINRVRACNLLPEYMDILEIEGSNITCRTTPYRTSFTISTESFSGQVYSLGVEKDETYISNNIVTHNCPLLNSSQPVPEGDRCPVEDTIMFMWITKHLKALGISPHEIQDPENSFDMDMLYEMAGQELIRWRCGVHLSQNPNIVEERQTGATPHGEPIFAEVLRPVLMAMETAGRNIHRIREALLATRKSQVAAGQLAADLTQKQSNLMEKTRKLVEARLEKGKEQVKDVDYEIKKDEE